MLLVFLANIPSFANWVIDVYQIHCFFKNKVNDREFGKSIVYFVFMQILLGKRESEVLSA